MSLKSFLENVVSHITTFINSILPSSKKFLDIALEVVNGIKAFTDSPAADVLAAIIPSGVGAAVIDKIKAILPTILIDLKLADAEAGKSADDIVKDGITAIKSMPAKPQSTTLQSIWQLLSDGLTDDGVSLTDLQKIGQAYYEQSKLAA